LISLPLDRVVFDIGFLIRKRPNVAPEFVHALSRALVIGLFGGAGLVLTQLYSRRGPLIYPVYAAILFVLALSLARTPSLGFAARLLVAFAAVMLSTLAALVATIILGNRQRQRLRESGRPLAPGRAPLWGFPLILLVLVIASAGVAFVSS
jgi:hypothetical protein